MKTATRSEIRAAAYLDAVRGELVDVPWSSRTDLLATVRERLAELPDNAVPEHELGPPRDYARELRAAAGLAPRRRSPWALLRGMRPRVLILAVVAIVVLAAAIAGLVYRAHYQPLSVDAYLGYSNAQVITDPLVTDTDFYRYEPGKIVVTGMALHNSGWATVHIDGAELPVSPLGPLVVTELRATTDQNIGGLWMRAPKVDRVSVAPAKTVTVFVVMKVTKFRIGPGGAMTMAQPKLRTHVLGIEHTVPIQGNEISLVGPDQ
jgi:hypothetical protein